MAILLNLVKSCLVLSVLVHCKFVDASKALYIVNHITLFKEPCERDFPGHVLGLLSYLNNKHVHV